MSTSQFIIRLPSDVATRFRVVVPLRARNKFVVELLQKAIQGEEGELAKIARAVTSEESKGSFKKEFFLWDKTIGDGLDK